MYRSRLAPAVAFLAFAIFSPYVFATGNVLVPSDDVTPPAQTPDASSNDSDAGNAASTEARPADTSKPSPPLNYTPVTAGMAAAMPSMATNVVEVPALALSKLRAKTNLPYSLAVILPHNFEWSKQDLGAIQNALGTPPEAAVQHCRLSATGALDTSGGTRFYTYDLGLTGNALVPYDGYIRSMSLYLRALCDIGGPLPPNGGMVMKIDDKYAVTLPTMVSCTPPSPQIRQAIVQYNPNGNGNCEFH